MRRLLPFTLFALSATCLGIGCYDNLSYEIVVRQPQHDGLECTAVCETTIGEDQNLHVSSCEEMLTLDDEPAVICHFWETVI